MNGLDTYITGFILLKMYRKQQLIIRRKTQGKHDENDTIIKIIATKGRVLKKTMLETTIHLTCR